MAPNVIHKGAEQVEGRITILIVDDQEPVRMFAEKVLQRQGYQCLVAESGESGFDTASRHKGEVAVLLTDLMMTGMNGLELGAAVTSEHPATRVLVMSGTDPDTFLLNQGFGFLPKPFTPDQLCEAILNMLRTIPGFNTSKGSVEEEGPAQRRNA